MIITEIYRLFKSPYTNKHKILDTQKEKFKQVIDKAVSKTPFYIKKYGEVLSEDSVDLKSLPLKTSAEFREVKIEALLSCAIDNKNFLLQATSGSTGSPLRIYVHNRENRTRQLMVIRSLWEHGWKPWWRGVYLWRPIETAGRPLFQSAINNRRHFIWIYLPLEEQVKQLKALKPDLLFGPIGPLKALALFIIDKNKKQI